MKQVGLFGGSFDPIHVGHVALAKGILEQCHLDEVWLMVSPQNPLKQQSDLSDDQTRFEMAQLALEDVPGVKACDYEFQLPKPSYTWNTLQALTTAYPDRRFVLLDAPLPFPVLCFSGGNAGRNRWLPTSKNEDSIPLPSSPKGRRTFTGNDNNYLWQKKQKTRVC